MITQTQLKDVIDYDPGTGRFTWARSRPACRKGDECGRIGKDGYREIGVLGTLYRANRLAVLYMTGEMPADKWVDHKNRNKADNRWCNLRVATPSQNMANVERRVNNTSGRSGVTWDAARGKWRAQIRIGGVKKSLGRFVTKEEAIARVQSVAVAQWGEFWSAA